MPHIFNFDRIPRSEAVFARILTEKHRPLSIRRAVLAEILCGPMRVQSPLSSNSP